HRYRHPLGAAQYLNLHFRPRRDSRYHTRQFGRILHLVALKPDDDIAPLQASLRGWTIGHDIRDQGPMRILEIKRFEKVWRNTLNRHPQPATRDIAFVVELQEHLFGQIDG